MAGQIPWSDCNKDLSACKTKRCQTDERGRERGSVCSGTHLHDYGGVRSARFLPQKCYERGHLPVSGHREEPPPPCGDASIQAGQSGERYEDCEDTLVNVEREVATIRDG